MDTVNNLLLYHVNQIGDKFNLFGYRSGQNFLRKVIVSADFDINKRQTSVSEIPTNSGLVELEDGSFALINWDSGIQDYKASKFDENGKLQFSEPVGSLIGTTQLTFNLVPAASANSPKPANSWE